jgi:hypothetical protein
MDDSDEFFIFLAIGDRSPRLLEDVLSDLSASFDFFPFLPPNRPPKMPFFFFLASPLSDASVSADFDFCEEGVVGGSSTSCPVLVASTFITCEVGMGALS